MPSSSPFPGMDPFIEGRDWEDFHQGFIGELSTALVPRVRPRYIVRKERRIYVEHHLSDADDVIRGDVAVLSRERQEPRSEEPLSSPGSITPVLVGLPMPEEVREAFLTIRERDSLEVVTVLEVLSPGNKRSGSDGRARYLSKREEILQSTSHLVELDLLRGGKRLPTVDPLPVADYHTFVCRNQHRYRAEVYAWSLRDRLPTIPVPLAANDPDVLVDLQEVFKSTYDRAGYDYSLDYASPVVPPLPTADADWVRDLLEKLKNEE